MFSNLYHISLVTAKLNVFFATWDNENRSIILSSAWKRYINKFHYGEILLKTLCEVNAKNREFALPG